MKKEIYEKSIAASKRFLNDKYIPTPPYVNYFYVDGQTSYRSNHDIALLYIRKVAK